MVNPTTQEWYDLAEAAQFLSNLIGQKLDDRDVLLCALNRGLQLVVDIPTGTTDKQGRELEGGRWELIASGKIGDPARQELQHRINPNVSLDGITGAWVRRGSVDRQLRPEGYPNKGCSAIPAGFRIGVAKKAALDRLAAQLKKEFAPPKAADDLDKPLGERERTTLLAIIAAMAAEAEIDLSHPSTAASVVVAKLQLMGVRLGQTTVEVHLKKAIEASEKLME